MSDVVIAIILGIVEGVTEFLPISSTGHLIVVGNLLGFTGEKAATFEIVIQLGAILAVVWLYRTRILSLLTARQQPGFGGPRGIALLAVTTLPALILGVLLHSTIKSRLFTPLTVAIGLGLGGIAILLVERRLPKPRVNGLDELRWPQALAIGLFQCLALWPGVSRSGATIVGAMLVRVKRATAAEYSFLSAIPVMGAATVYDLYKSLNLLSVSDIPIFAIGMVTAFVAALIAVTGFVRLLGRVTLTPFGWYRIVAAVLVLVLLRGAQIA